MFRINVLRYFSEARHLLRRIKVFVMYACSGDGCQVSIALGTPSPVPKWNQLPLFTTFCVSPCKMGGNFPSAFTLHLCRASHSVCPRVCLSVVPILVFLSVVPTLSVSYTVPTVLLFVVPSPPPVFRFVCLCLA
jgi:hypothetical protein